MMEDSDALMVARAQTGDQDAFRTLVERHSHALFRLAYRMTGNEEDAEEIVQETFLRAHRQLARFQARASFRTWLHRIAANCSLDLLRKRRRTPASRLILDDTDTLSQVPTPAAGPAELAAHAEVAQHVHSALDQLTRMERTAFVLRHFEDRSIDEIGRALDLGQSAAKQAIFRAVQKVRRALEPVLRSVR